MDTHLILIFTTMIIITTLVPTISRVFFHTQITSPTHIRMLLYQVQFQHHKFQWHKF